jgi:hypothetical protein
MPPEIHALSWQAGPRMADQMWLCEFSFHKGPEPENKSWAMVTKGTLWLPGTKGSLV